MGFESSQMARRRLAAQAASNRAVEEALAPSAFPGFGGTDEQPIAASPASTVGASSSMHAALSRQFEDLAYDIMLTPGAGAALLAAYTAQARALTLVSEAARRHDGAPLPEAVLEAVREALLTHIPMRMDLKAG